MVYHSIKVSQYQMNFTIYYNSSQNGTIIHDFQIKCKTSATLEQGKI